MDFGSIKIDRAELLNESDWLARREHFIGSSDAAALFNEGYSFRPSRWSLWAHKAGHTPAEPDDDRMNWGKWLEPVILKAVAIRTGWEVRYPSGDNSGEKYCLIPEPGKEPKLACTVDAYVIDHERDGFGIIECKNRDFLQWRDNYTDDEAAARDRIQLAQQFLCIPEAQWGCIAVLVGGNDLKTYFYTPMDLADIMVDIVNEAADMTRRIAENDEPPLIDDRDVPSWLRVHRDEFTPSMVTAESIPDEAGFDGACRSYFENDPRAKLATKNASAAKAAIIGVARKHNAVRSNRWHANLKYSNTEASFVSLPDEFKSHLRQIAEHLDFKDANRDFLLSVANWTHETRKAGTRVSLDVSRIEGAPADDDADLDEALKGYGDAANMKAG